VVVWWAEQRSRDVLLIAVVLEPNCLQERWDQHQPSPPDGGRGEGAGFDQLVELGPTEAGGLARLENSAGWSLHERNVVFGSTRLFGSISKIGGLPEYVWQGGGR
jgi:hypothetical protein